MIDFPIMVAPSPTLTIASTFCTISPAFIDKEVAASVCMALPDMSTSPPPVALSLVDDCDKDATTTDKVVDVVEE